MSVQNKPRSSLRGSLVILACLASGNAACAQETPTLVPGGSALGPLTTAFGSSSGDVATAAAGAIGGVRGGGDTSGAGGGVATSGGTSLSRLRNSANVSTLGAGGSSVPINITLGGGSVSPVQ